MKRRSLLTVLATGAVPIAGCVGQGQRGTEDSPREVSTSTTDDVPSASPPEATPREVSVSSVDDVPADSPLELTVEVTRSSVTADRTARIRVSATNTADRTVWNTALVQVFGDFISEVGSTGQRLVLLPPDEQYDTVHPDCWRADISEPELNWTYSDVVVPVRYDVDETRAIAFDVYGHPENTGACLAPGDYRVENRYSIDDDRGTFSDDPVAEFDWGFTITVSRP